MNQATGKSRSSRKSYGRSTLQDVARVAGVSAITASRALRTPELVAEATRLRVMAAVTKVGYIPNYVAGSLASTRTRTIAAITPTLENSIFTEMLQGMIDVLRPAGYQLIVANSNYHLGEEEALVAAFLARQVDGLMLTGGSHSERVRTLLHHTDLPVVETWSLPQQPIKSTVGFSNHDAAYAMTQHLASHGYREIGFVSAPLQHNDRAVERRRGFLGALDDLGLPVRADAILESPFGLEAGASMLRHILEVHPRTDAVFFANDTLAIGALLECQRSGIRVPGDVAIAGFDDLEIASQIVPTLSTIRVHRYELGTRAATNLLDTLEGRCDTPTTLDVGFEVVLRAST